MGSVALLCWGFAAVPRQLTVAWLALSAAVLVHGGPFIGQGFAAVAVIALGYLACHTGAAMQRNPQTLAAVLLGWIAASTINALEGLLQYFGLEGDLYPWVAESLRNGVAFGAFRQPNVFAVFLVAGVVCSAWAVRRGTLSSVMGWTACAVLELGIAASTSRIGLVCVLLVSAGALVLERKQGSTARSLLVCQPLVYAVAAIGLPWLASLHGFEPRDLQGRLSGISTDSRLLLWSNVLELIRARPWTGWGWGEFGFAHYEVLLPERFGGGTQVVQNGHNLVLHMAVELGSLAAAVTLAAGLALAKFLTKTARSLPEGAYPVLILLVLAAHSMVEFPLWWATHMLLAGLMLGYLSSASSSDRAEAARTSKAVPLQALPPLLCAVLLAGAIEAGRQYAAVARAYLTPSSDAEKKVDAIRSAQSAWLFRADIEYAELARLPLDERSAAEVMSRSLRLLHHSAEPVVIGRLLESAWLAGRKDVVAHHAPRFRAAFPPLFDYWLEVMHHRRIDLADFVEQVLARNAACPPMLPLSARDRDTVDSRDSCLAGPGNTVDAPRALAPE